MLLSLLTLAFQLNAASPGDAPRAAERARSVQGAFERFRRGRLPWSLGGAGRCDVRVGRFCWWYEDTQAPAAPEPDDVARSRRGLIATLDSLGHASPDDAWIAGMRVHYRLDGGLPLAADSAARQCSAVAWWCDALRGYAALGSNRVNVADSAFASAVRGMPDSTRCAWLDIRTLLPAALREGYERASCAERSATENRYWLLATPRLGAPANEWRLEFMGRRVAATLLADAVTPHRLRWGRDTEELLLRYGWPVSWSRTLPSSIAVSDPDILGHDPAPSFHYGASVALLRDTAASGSEGWNLRDVHGESRYAQRDIRQLAEMSAQLVRFRRGDSTLVVAAWSSSDDSLRAATATLGVGRPDGTLVSRTLGAGQHGAGQLQLAGAIAVIGMELFDSASGTLARTRSVLGTERHARALSDILLFQPLDNDAPSLDEALARALPGDAFPRSHRLGLYWESYGEPQGEGSRETTIRVERLDHGLVASVRERLGLADPDAPVVVRWTEARPVAGAVSARSLSLDLSRLPAGRYRIGVALSDGALEPLATMREVLLADP